jgi:hypothetical protein
MYRSYAIPELVQRTRIWDMRSLWPCQKSGHKDRRMPCLRSLVCLFPRQVILSQIPDPFPQQTTLRAPLKRLLEYPNARMLTNQPIRVSNCSFFGHAPRTPLLALQLRLPLPERLAIRCVHQTVEFSQPPLLLIFALCVAPRCLLLQDIGVTRQAFQYDPRAQLSPASQPAVAVTQPLHAINL